MRLFVALSLATLSASSCATPSSSLVEVQVAALADCGSLPSQDILTVSVVPATGAAYELDILKGSKVQLSREETGGRTHGAGSSPPLPGSFWKETYPDLPEVGPSGRYRGYPATLFDRRLIAAATYPDSDRRGASSLLEIGPMAGTRIVDVGMRITDLAWSAGGRNLAVIVGQDDRRVRSLSGALVKLAGWDMVYTDYFLRILDSEGHTQCQSVIAINTIDTRVVVNWKVR